MRGHFDLTLYDSAGHRDEDFKRARERGELSSLLESLKVDGRYEADNLVFHGIVSHLLYALMSGPSALSSFTTNTGAQAMLAFVGLCTRSDEPSYQEWTGGDYGYYAPIGNFYEMCTADGAKRFVEDQIESYQLARDPNGREALYFRNRWLWLPSEGVASTIRSLQVVNNDDGDSTSKGSSYGPAYRVARVRLRDSAGNPVTINKLSTQALLMDYTFMLVSV